MMIPIYNELETVVLTRDIKEYNLRSSDIGTIIHIYEDKRAVEVEFITAKGKTVAVLTLTPSDIRPIAQDEMLHARVASA